MRTAVDIVVYICMLLAIYHNWTSKPDPEPIREVRGLLEKTK